MAAPEKWIDINPRYSVSDRGRVRSNDWTGIDKRGRERRKRGKMLSLCDRGDGYFVVNVSGFRHKINWKVHQLVAIHFLPNICDYRSINHKNGDKQDNRKDNLEWCTQAHNNLHAFRELGRDPVKTFGHNNGMSRAVYNKTDGTHYECIREAAESMGMKYSTLSSMLNGQNRNSTQLRYV